MLFNDYVSAAGKHGGDSKCCKEDVWLYAIINHNKFSLKQPTMSVSVRKVRTNFHIERSGIISPKPNTSQYVYERSLTLSRFDPTR